MDGGEAIQVRVRALDKEKERQKEKLMYRRMEGWKNKGRVK